MTLLDVRWIFLLGVVKLCSYICNNEIGSLMLKVKVTSIGNSMGIVLPKEALAKLKIGKGETLYLVDSPEGFMLTPYQQNFEQQMDAAEMVMKKYRNALHELAK